MKASCVTKTSGGLRQFAFLCALCFCAAQAALAREAAPLAQDEAVEARMVHLTENLRCLVCQNESLAASRADLAVDLRREIREQITAGKSDAQILEFMVERYGDFVFYKPPLKNTTYLLWFGPFGLLLAGIAALLLFLRRRAKNPVTAELSAQELEQAEALLHPDQERKGPA